MQLLKLLNVKKHQWHQRKKFLLEALLKIVSVEYLVLLSNLQQLQSQSMNYLQELLKVLLFADQVQLQQKFYE
jgi:hypothetical protein